VASELSGALAEVGDVFEGLRPKSVAFQRDSRKVFSVRFTQQLISVDSRAHLTASPTR
jgi:hypothetical protein